MNNVLLITTVALAATFVGLSTADTIGIGRPCNPKENNTCVHGAECNHKTKLCDCADSEDGTFKRTFQNGECKLLPGSVCVPGVDQYFYRCVQNAKCVTTRKGQDRKKCPADAPCDLGDSFCVCGKGKTCLTKDVPVPPFIEPSVAEKTRGLGKSCTPGVEDACVYGAECNPKTKICDCADSVDKTFKRTYQDGECKLLPGSVCVPGLDKDYYRCVQDSKCVLTRKGQDPDKCPLDAPCDLGDSFCTCSKGKTCLTKDVPVPVPQAVKTEDHTIEVGRPCHPSEKDACVYGAECNPKTKVCDCADSEDKEYKRTYQDGACRLLPGSVCLPWYEEEDFYSCVQNSQCVETRKGQDPEKCPADAPCDLGDHACICDKGKTCLNIDVPAPAVGGRSNEHSKMGHGTTCNPAVPDDCGPGRECNPKTKICDCADSEDKTYKRTFQDGECKLLPGSFCIPWMKAEEPYRCVKNSKCVTTRKGQDPNKCAQDAPCDRGDSFCICDKGKICETRDLAIPASVPHSKTGPKILVGKPCNPSVKDGCIHGAECNPKTKICDCADSPDKRYRRTFENGQCRLLPGSVCVNRLDQDFYRCVKNSQCTQTRKGTDPRLCLADAPCDTGDFFCMCDKGKTCLLKDVPAPAIGGRSHEHNNFGHETSCNPADPDDDCDPGRE